MLTTKTFTVFSLYAHTVAVANVVPSSSTSISPSSECQFLIPLNDTVVERFVVSGDRFSILVSSSVILISFEHEDGVRCSAAVPEVLCFTAIYGLLHFPFLLP